MRALPIMNVNHAYLKANNSKADSQANNNLDSMQRNVSFTSLDFFSRASVGGASLGKTSLSKTFLGKSLAKVFETKYYSEAEVIEKLRNAKSGFYIGVQRPEGLVYESFWQNAMDLYTGDAQGQYLFKNPKGTGFTPFDVKLALQSKVQRAIAVVEDGLQILSLPKQELRKKAVDAYFASKISRESMLHESHLLPSSQVKELIKEINCEGLKLTEKPFNSLA